ncbi:EPD1, essential for pseudohyphal development protein 1 [Cordyceps militaris CM01]|uniref:1,3-beta-glucanosyltransferase n=1 Tax=Cordyceps militaris (strain CM01) TaxID=983644 RepID=G3JLY7_CORMM|nr:EPD1, essential for pseudohyphal development protein 1 [Cordyceps militaris CM01]EGX90711.1 EPD1, essential for pseudohyphal development protein 1 [Cordyceps militaris CM01]
MVRTYLISSTSARPGFCSWLEDEVRDWTFWWYGRRRDSGNAKWAQGLQQPSCSHRCPAYSGLQGLLGAITHCGTTAPLSTVQASHSSALPILAPVRHRLLAIIPNNAITKLPSYLDISLVATLLRRYRLGRVWAGSWCCRLEQTLATSVALARLGPVPSLLLHLPQISKAMKSAVSLLALAGAAAAADLPAIVAKGSKFFYPNGTQFFMKGIAYQRDIGAAGAKSDPTAKYMDPLADKDACKRDVPYLQDLNINIIRTYAIDPKEDHSYCMGLLQDAGIYVVSDLSEPATSINRDDPQWNTELFDRYKAVVDELSKYPNVVGFFAGNEVSNSANNTGASAFVKAAVRDTKKYIKDNQKRWIGVGYAANDDKDIRKEIADYFNCGKAEESIDFWGYNIYSWCGTSSMQLSGYDQQVKFFQDFSVPVFLAEYGCNLPNGAKGRKWEETAALYSDDMTGVFSGGLVYMYFQEENDYGVVEVKGSSIEKQDDYDGLKKAHAAADPKGITMDKYTPSGKSAQCPDVSKAWMAAAQLPPTPDKDLCKCMSDSLECVVADNLDVKSYGDLFGSVCGASPKICAGINAVTKLGNYGAYSMCSPKEKLSFVLDAYYQANGKTSDACGWKGAKIQKGTTASNCQKSLSDAKAQNSAIATATSNVSAPKATGGSSSGNGKENFGVRTAPSGVLAAGVVAMAALLTL